MGKTNIENFLEKYEQSDDDEQTTKDFQNLTEEDQKQVSEILFGMFKDTSKHQSK